MAGLVLALGVSDTIAREGILICALPSAVMPTILVTLPIVVLLNGN